MSVTADITPAIMRLVHSEPFFANLLMGMTRNYTTDIPTVGVNVTDTVNLHINPYFWDSMSVEEQVAVLKHECYHVLNNHIGRFKELEPHIFEEKQDDVIQRIKAMMEFKTLNMAADVAINQFIPGIPKKMKFFDKDGNAVLQPDMIDDGKGNQIANPDAGQPVTGEPITLEYIKKLVPKAEAKELMEYYYELLQQYKQKHGKKVKISMGGNPGDSNPGQSGMGQQGQGDMNDPFDGLTTIDDHSIWQTGNQNEEHVKEKLKKVVNEAAEKTNSQKSAGNIPSDIQVLIEALNHQPRDWRSDLQKFAAKTSEIIIELSRKRRDRRYGIQQPGKTIFSKLKLAVAVDTSGSCFDQETLGQFSAEIERIAKFASVTVLTFDAEIQQEFEYNSRTFNSIPFKGGGGTLFAPVFDRCAELEIDGLIMLTDGCNFEGDKLKKPRFNLLWALLKGYDTSYKFGYKTTIEIKRKTKVA